LAYHDIGPEFEVTLANIEAAVGHGAPPSTEVIQAEVPAEQLQSEELLQHVLSLQERILAVELKMQTVMDEEVRRSAELQRTQAESEARLLALEARVSQIQLQVLQFQNTIMSSGSSAVPQRKHNA
jgi:hypothetical protein